MYVPADETIRCTYSQNMKLLLPELEQQWRCLLYIGKIIHFNFHLLYFHMFCHDTSRESHVFISIMTIYDAILSAISQHCIGAKSYRRLASQTTPTVIYGKTIQYCLNWAKGINAKHLVLSFDNLANQHIIQILKDTKGKLYCIHICFEYIVNKIYLLGQYISYLGRSRYEAQLSSHS